MKNKLLEAILALNSINALNHIDSYDVIGIPLKYLFDEKLNDCLMYMYFTMMSENDEKKEMYYNEFIKRYEELDNERRLIVQRDFENIIKSQDENNDIEEIKNTQDKNKEKVKKKGMIDYE